MAKNEKALKTAETIVEGIGTSLEVNSSLRELIAAECDKAGLTDEELFAGLKEGMSATKMSLDKFGEEHWENDSATRHKYIVTVLELKGYLKAKAEGAQVNIFNMNAAEIEELERIKGRVYDVA